VRNIGEESKLIPTMKGTLAGLAYIILLPLAAITFIFLLGARKLAAALKSLVKSGRRGKL
jgi:hypothetical protein